MKTHATGVAALLVVAASVALDADRVRLRSGKVVDGMFIGGDSKNVRILLDDGIVSEVPLAEAVAVEFSSRKPPSPPPAAPAAAPAKAAAPAPAKTAAAAPRPAVTVPAGTPVNVLLAQAIDVDLSQAGQRFKAVVDDPVMVGGSIVIPRGASASLQAVQVDQSGQMKGSDKITLKLNTITFGGMVHEVTTSYVETKGKGEGKKTARKVGGGAGLGAIVGGIAGGGQGAAIGAVVGGVGGAAVASGGEEHLKLPAETRLQFQLTHAVTIR
jgi:outer membrane lipoprotein SlyB